MVRDKSRSDVDSEEITLAFGTNLWTFRHHEVDWEAKPIDAARQLYLLSVED